MKTKKCPFKKDKMFFKQKALEGPRATWMLRAGRSGHGVAGLPAGSRCASGKVPLNAPQALPGLALFGNRREALRVLCFQ